MNFVTQDQKIQRLLELAEQVGNGVAAGFIDPEMEDEVVEMAQLVTDLQDALNSLR